MYAQRANPGDTHAGFVQKKYEWEWIPYKGYIKDHSEHLFFAEGFGLVG